MIKKIIKALKANSQVSDYKITELTNKSHQAFFVLGKLETTRLVETTEYEVTVYVRHDSKIGDSSFVVSHELSKADLESLINQAVLSAGFISNKDYNLVKGTSKKKYIDKPFNDSFDEIINKLNEIMARVSKPNIKFNAVEVFYDEKIKHIVNSCDVDLTSDSYSLSIESIPSYDGNSKVEVYKFNEYEVLDYNKIESDMVSSLKDVTARYSAVKLPDIKSSDIIIKDHEVLDFFRNFIRDYSYNNVYSGGTNKKTGDALQLENAKTKLTISLSPSSKSMSFDDSGLILKKNVIVENGILKNYYGSNQYAQYLGLEPKGMPDEIEVKKGNKSYEQITKGNYIEIISLSGIQIDPDADYIGGEVRLGILHDGETATPVNGFSFSGSFKDAVNTLVLSKETVKIKNYNGPKYLRIRNMKVL